MEDDRIQITIIGDGKVGKTSLLYRYTSDKFTENYEPTIFDNYAAIIDIDGESHRIQLWDTAGQEEYDKLRALSYSHVSYQNHVYHLILLFNYSIIYLMRLLLHSND